MKWKFYFLMTFFVRFDKKKPIEILLENVCYSYWLKVFIFISYFILFFSLMKFLRTSNGSIDKQYSCGADNIA